MGNWAHQRYAQAIVVPLEDPAGQQGSGPGMFIVLLVLALVGVLAAPRLIDALDPADRERHRLLEEAQIRHQQAETQIEAERAAAEIEREKIKAAAEERRREERHQAWLRFLASLGEGAGTAGYGALVLPFVWGAVKLAQLAASEARQARQDRITLQALRQARMATPDLLAAKRREREQRHAFERMRYQAERAKQENDRLTRELARERARQALEVLPETTPN